MYWSLLHAYPTGPSRSACMPPRARFISVIPTLMMVRVFPSPDVVHWQWRWDAELGGIYQGFHRRLTQCTPTTTRSNLLLLRSVWRGCACRYRRNIETVRRHTSHNISS